MFAVSQTALSFAALIFSVLCYHCAQLMGAVGSRDKSMVTLCHNSYVLLTIFEVLHSEHGHTPSACRLVHVRTFINASLALMFGGRNNDTLALQAPWPQPGEENLPRATFAAGCFWGPELHFQRAPGVVSTAVGYTGA